MKKDIFILSIIFIILFSFPGVDLIGLTSILIVTLIIFFLAKRWPSTASILYVALAVRILLIFLDNNFITLPDSQGDARIFELQAYEWSKVGFPNVLKINPGWAESFFISYIIAIFYSIADRSVMLAQSISLLFGTLSVLMSWILAQKLWDNRTAMKVGWFVALFPSLVLYSVLIMREIYVCFFLLVALNNVVNWTRTGSLKSFFLVIFSFMLGTTFHGGVFIGLIVFLTIVLILNIKTLLRKLINGLITFKSFMSFALIVVLIAYYALNNIFIPKIGVITDFEQIKKDVLKKNLVTHRGSAKYPDWVIAKSETELIYKIPVRVIYFIFSPFPWDLKKISHMLGVFDSFLYMFLVYLIFRNRKAIWADPALRIILLILLAYLFVYGIAIANFGTGLRHRAKFTIMFILLAAPLLPKFTFSRKIK